MEFYFQNGLAASTRRSYSSAKNRYIKFCQSKGLTPLPASEHQLCQFASCLANQNLGHSSIKCYLSAVRHLHVAEGHGDPHVAEGHGDPHISCMARLEQVLKGIKGVQVRTVPKQTRLPITPELLLKMRQVWMAADGGSKWDHIMLWAACLLCFFGFLRSGEISVPLDSMFDSGAHLAFSDVSVDSTESPKVMRVHIKASKTDPFRVGVDIFIGRTVN